MMKIFELSDEQAKKLKKWIEEETPKRSIDPTGVSITYHFTPTSIGTIIKVSCGKKEIDLSEYETW
jgi:F0F1-type ATP synthase delta subunit